jgi:hypothetical protein
MHTLDAPRATSFITYMHHVALQKNPHCSRQSKWTISTWPDISTDAVSKDLTITYATTLGHINQQCTNLHSTQEQINDAAITSDGHAKSHFVYAVIDAGCHAG